MSSEAEPVPLVVRGNATPEELAAVVAVLLRRSGGPAAEAPVEPVLWSRPQLRRPVHPGRGAWGASYLPC